MNIHVELQIVQVFVSSLRGGTGAILLRNNKSSAITMETLHLCPQPLCHHRCQSWKNLVSLCACDSRDYVTVKAISIPLTLSEKLASPRKPKTTSGDNESENASQKSQPKKNKAFLQSLPEKCQFHIVQKNEWGSNVWGMGLNVAEVTRKCD